ncbi:uncharacterized protein METZ01_LOCUS98267, partial [marine metagenome]
TKVISEACARGLVSSSGGVLNIPSEDDQVPAVKVKKVSVTSGKVLNLVEEAALSEPEDIEVEESEIEVNKDESNIEESQDEKSDVEKKDEVSEEEKIESEEEK